jgi:D-alanyl-lipoteichoic acid acyltransferase DltB (MBOAT superfamily)
MLFNSYEFLFAFLPVVLAVYHVLRAGDRQRAAKLFLVAASLFFYGWWNYRYVALVTVSIAVNYGLSLLIARYKDRAKAFLILALVFNLGLLGYFKYANFFVDAVSGLTGLDLQMKKVVLPLAISFFTFQQIAYIVEVFKDRRAADSLTDYCLFVLFFPHLIAGPITHHKEMLPQFKQAGHGPLPHVFITVGVTVFILGIAKKVLLADTLASIANPVFAAAHRGEALDAASAWLGALAYTFQLYFDFSGYSDMAIGLALLFGIRMPVNFASPYKSTSIIEFWRRWHISLSRFLRNYLYIPLGGSRKGPIRRHLNLLVTMALGGLWHGAGWTFLAWGLLHGSFLVINHLWRGMVGQRGGWPRAAFGWTLTFFGVVAGWVLFRAESFPAALEVLKAMGGMSHPLALPEIPGTAADWLGVGVGAAIAFFLPNSLEIAGYPHKVPDALSAAEEAPITPRTWRIAAPATAAILGVIAAVVIAKLPDPGVFLYFNF